MRIKALGLIIVGCSLVSLDFVCPSHGGKTTVAECHKTKKDGKANCVVAAYTAPKNTVGTLFSDKGGVWAFEDCEFFSVGLVAGKQKHAQSTGYTNPNKGLESTVEHTIKDLFDSAVKSMKPGVLPSVFFEFFLGKNISDKRIVTYIENLQRKEKEAYKGGLNFSLPKKDAGSDTCKITYTSDGKTVTFYLTNLEAQTNTDDIKISNRKADYKLKIKAEAEAHISNEELEKVFSTLIKEEKE